MQTMYPVGTVSNAMRGKRLLEERGIRAYIRRHTEADEKNGCGYSLIVPHATSETVSILQAGGVRVLTAKGRRMT